MFYANVIVLEIYTQNSHFIYLMVLVIGPRESHVASDTLTGCFPTADVIILFWFKPLPGQC